MQNSQPYLHRGVRPPAAHNDDAKPVTSAASNAFPEKKRRKYLGTRSLTLGAILLAAAACSSSSSNDASKPNGQKPPIQNGSNGKQPTKFWTDNTEATEKAKEMLGRMTLDEKVNLMHGEFYPIYSFYNAPIDRLGIPALQAADGPVGIRVADPKVNDQKSTMLPSGPALAATWDAELAHKYGNILGSEARATNHNAVLGPSPDIIRVLQWGRAFEAFSEDPLLSGVMASNSILGIQSNDVIAVVKHYVAYNQEEHRLPVIADNPEREGERLNVIVDERTLQEIYVRPFAQSIHEGSPGSVMCGFQQIDGVYGCEDKHLLTDVLKDQIGFQGWVMSDYDSIYSTVPSVMAGADQEMPGNIDPDEGPGDCFFCGPLLDAVDNGEVPESRIDDAVIRILRPFYAMDLFDNPPKAKALPEKEHAEIAQDIAEKSIVLLKNESTLPLNDKDIESIAVIGADANVLVVGGGSALNIPTQSVPLLDGIEKRAGKDIKVEHAPGYDPLTSVALLPGPDPLPSDYLIPSKGEGEGLRAEYFLNENFEGEPELDRVEPYVGINGGFFWFGGFNGNSPNFPDLPVELNDHNTSVRWTGEITAPTTGDYVFELNASGTSRLFIDDEEVASTEPAQGSVVTKTGTVNMEAGSKHDIRVEYIWDAPPLIPNDGPKFKLSWTTPESVVRPKIEEAAKLAADSDIAIVMVRDFAGEGGDRPSLALPFGQAELIRKVAAANPRTIVVMTTSSAVITSDWDDQVPAIVQAWYGGQQQGAAIAGILFGDVNPSGRLPITIPVNDDSTPISSQAQYPGGEEQQYSEGIFVGYRGYEEFNIAPRFAFGHGLSYTDFKYDKLEVHEGKNPSEESPLGVTVTVENTGKVEGIETVQVYVGKLPAEIDTADRALAGFAKVRLKPGESREVVVQLNRQSLSYWDTELGRWVTPKGEVPIYVGASSRDIRLEGKGVIPAEADLGNLGGNKKNDEKNKDGNDIADTSKDDKPDKQDKNEKERT